MLRLLPVIFVCLGHQEVKAGLRLYNTDVISHIFPLLVITAVPFAAVFFFYTRASVIAALFTSSKKADSTEVVASV